MFSGPFPSPLALLPQPVTAVGLGVTLNLFFKRYPELKERLSELGGKLFHFEVEDLDQSFYMVVEQDGHVRIHTYSDDPINVTMSGNSQAFIQLLFNVKDPDSLFFARKLKMSGETETGLHFKNILDNVEIDWERELSFVMGDMGARMANRVGTRLRDFMQDQRDGLEESTDEWLDSQEMPRRNDIDNLSDATEALVESVEKVERRIHRMENRLKIRQSDLPSGQIVDT
uniref:Ubiquinone biosynthesis accessory factor UbiJ n=1 Tax=Magnetococcus massalia (strain MO-1) TaxID=451514 RepID=A0A1S7LK56_MAGMO|nr:putative lipid carrier protein-like protein [Candidatus Magnetococcus massalia]